MVFTLVSKIWREPVRHCSGSIARDHGYFLPDRRLRCWYIRLSASAVDRWTATHFPRFDTMGYAFRRYVMPVRYRSITFGFVFQCLSSLRIPRASSKQIALLSIRVLHGESSTETRQWSSRNRRSYNLFFRIIESPDQADHPVFIGCFSTFTVDIDLLLSADQNRTMARIAKLHLRNLTRISSVQPNIDYLFWTSPVSSCASFYPSSPTIRTIACFGRRSGISSTRASPQSFSRNEYPLRSR